LPLTPFGAGKYPSALAIADLNGDRIPDLVVADRDNNTIISLLGKGDGTFVPSQITPTGREPAAVAAADFDGDGLVDVATADSGSAAVTILRGRANGEFRYVGQFPAGDHPVQ